MLNSITIAIAVSTIKSVFKKAENKRKYRNIMLDIFKAIKMAYAGDPDFQ